MRQTETVSFQTNFHTKKCKSTFIPSDGMSSDGCANFFAGFLHYWGGSALQDTACAFSSHSCWANEAVMIRTCTDHSQKQKHTPHQKSKLGILDRRTCVDESGKTCSVNQCKNLWRFVFPKRKKNCREVFQQRHVWHLSEKWCTEAPLSLNHPWSAGQNCTRCVVITRSTFARF